MFRVSQHTLKWHQNLKAKTLYVFLSDTTRTNQNIPLWRRSVNFLCGVDEKSGAPNLEDYLPKLSKVEVAQNAAETLKEQLFWKW